MLTLIFRIADDGSLLLLDIKDLRSILQYAGENAASFTTEYGRIPRASAGAIQKKLLSLEYQGGDIFFVEPTFNFDGFLQTDENENGIINILAANKLVRLHRVYTIFLHWLLSELFEQLPEASDPEKQKLVFFF